MGKEKELNWCRRQMHKNYCDYPHGPCDCGYWKKQEYHAKWCDYPKDYCSCDRGFSQHDIDSGKKYRQIKNNEH